MYSHLRGKAGLRSLPYPQEHAKVTQSQMRLPPSRLRSRHPASWRGPSLHSRFIFCLRAPPGWERRQNEGGRARTHTAERESLSRLQARNEQTVTPVPRPARPPLKLKLRSSKTERGPGRIASGGGREIPTRFRKGTEGDGKVERGKRDTAQTLPSRGAV